THSAPTAAPDGSVTVTSRRCGPPVSSSAGAGAPLERAPPETSEEPPAAPGGEPPGSVERPPCAAPRVPPPVVTSAVPRSSSTPTSYDSESASSGDQATR